ncbi:MAG TPA: hypothetical protein VNO21_25100, partial [Polyangiaceae bacterium]|nr:hypothetical protein [Polyangiaceae bacterium]
LGTTILVGCAKTFASGGHPVPVVAPPSLSASTEAVIPDLVVRHWYHALLHNNRGAIMRGLLRLRGGPRVIVISTPFHLED